MSMSADDQMVRPDRGLRPLPQLIFASRRSAVGIASVERLSAPVYVQCHGNKKEDGH